MPTAQATGRVCLGDGTNLGHAPAASGMGAKKGTGIARDPERAEGSQGPPATLQHPQNTFTGKEDAPTRIHRQGFLLPTTLLLPWQFAGRLLCLLPTQEGELHGAQGLGSLLQPGLLDRPWAGRNRGHSPTQGERGSAIPRFDIFLQALPKICLPLCWVMALLSCL